MISVLHMHQMYSNWWKCKNFCQSDTLYSDCSVQSFHTVCIQRETIFEKQPGPWFNIKMLTCPYRKSHSSVIHNGNSYTGKTASLHWFSLKSKSLSELCVYFIRINIQDSCRLSHQLVPDWPFTRNSIITLLLRDLATELPVPSACAEIQWNLSITTT